MDILEAILYGEDLPAMEAFYSSLLDAQPFVKEEGRHLFYRLDRTMLLIFDPEESEKEHSDDTLPIPTHGARGPGHLAFAVSRVEQSALRQKLIAAGIPIEEEIEWPHGAHSIYIRDPAGNSVEFATPSLWAFPEA